jgi:hypothetical protein
MLMLHATPSLLALMEWRCVALLLLLLCCWPLLLCFSGCCCIAFVL